MKVSALFPPKTRGSDEVYLLPLMTVLRRKVKKIIAWVANMDDPRDEAAWQVWTGVCTAALL